MKFYNKGLYRQDKKSLIRQNKRLSLQAKSKQQLLSYKQPSTNTTNNLKTAETYNILKLKSQFLTLYDDFITH